ncbi:MAG: hypothetical protein SchgKO_05510 [Schleiferiaceae bacterium]
MNLILESSIVGFGIYSILLSGRKGAIEHAYPELFKTIDTLACVIFSIGGILFFGEWIYGQLTLYFVTSAPEEQSSQITEMFGEHSFMYWIEPIVYLFITQMMWIQGARNSMVLRFIIGILTLISFEHLILWIQQANNENLPADWAMVGWNGDTVIHWGVCFVTFAFIVLIAYLFKKDPFKKAI